MFYSGSFVVPVFVWRCQQASPERAVGAPVDANLTPMIAVTNVGTGATTPTTAIASAREAVEAGKVLQSTVCVVVGDMTDLFSACYYVSIC